MMEYKKVILRQILINDCKVQKCIAIVLTSESTISRRYMFLKGAITMAAKSANLYARIEPEVKEQAEGILSALGIPASNAINMFYKQIILHRGLPFEVKIPSARPLDMSILSEEQINEELEKGYVDMKTGRTKSASKIFEDIRKDYNL